MIKISTSFMSGGAALLLLAAPLTCAADDEAIPQEQLIKAIQTAVTAYPGNVQEADVEKKNGKRIVEVKITGADGKEKEISVDVEKNQVMK